MGAKRVPAKKAIKKAAPRKAAPAAAKKAPAKKAVKKAAPPRKRTPRRPRRPAQPPKAELEVIEGPALAYEVADVEVVWEGAEIDHPARRAYDLRVQGKTWLEVADRIDEFSSAEHASIAVRRWQEQAALRQGMAVAKDRLQLALDRVERIIDAAWDRAIAGDKDMMAVVLKANQDYFRMSGLEKASINVNSKNTILISGGPDMAEQLQAAALAREARAAAMNGVVIVTEAGQD